MSTTQAQTASKTVAAKTIKVNPSQSLIGLKMMSTDPISVNYRDGKSNIVSCNEIEIVSANATGRRLSCIFRKDGVQVLERKVYKEHVERMASKFNFDLP